MIGPVDVWTWTDGGSGPGPGPGALSPALYKRHRIHLGQWFLLCVALRGSIFGQPPRSA